MNLKPNTIQDRLSSLRLVYKIITDRRNEDRYLMTSIVSEDGTTRADYGSAVRTIEELLNEYGKQ